MKTTSIGAESVQPSARLIRHRLSVTALLAFASGLPLSLVGSTLQAWYTVSGASLLSIGLLSLVGQPYVYKFLWAPVLDRYTPPTFLGRRRGWILIFQIGLVLGLLSMSLLEPQHRPNALALLALCVALCSASHDVAIDAYRTDLLLPNERGMGASYTVLGYRIALLLSGGIAMMIADHIGWHNTYRLMALIIAATTFVTLWAPSEPIAVAPKSLRLAIVEPLCELIKRPSAILILGFLVLYKISDVVALSLSTPFLLREMHLSLTEVGVLYKTLGLVATLIASVIGGIGLSRLGYYRALWIFGVLQGLSIFTFVLLAIIGKQSAVLIIAIFTENFCSGLSTVALVALTMALCDARYTATQFAVLSAVEALPRVFIGPIAAGLVNWLGWSGFFVSAMILTIPALLLLRLLQKPLKLLTT